MIKAALEWIKNETAKIDVFTVNNEKYSNKLAYKLSEPTRETIELTTLTGIIDLIKSEFDGKEKLIVTVDNQEKVSVRTKLNSNKVRERIAVAYAELPKITLNQFIPLENMIIQLQATFVDNQDKAKVLALLGNIKSENITNHSDDGITQSVEVREGIATIAKKDVPSTVLLKPFRTFTEVAQPESAFVLRLRKENDNIRVALYECDGGAWKNNAILDIKQYIKHELLTVLDHVTILA